MQRLPETSCGKKRLIMVAHISLALVQAVQQITKILVHAATSQTFYNAWQNSQ